MKVQINGIECKYLDEIKGNDEIRNSFIEFINSSLEVTVQTPTKVNI